MSRSNLQLTKRTAEQLASGVARARPIEDHQTSDVALPHSYVYAMHPVLLSLMLICNIIAQGCWHMLMHTCCVAKWTPQLDYVTDELHPKKFSQLFQASGKIAMKHSGP